MAANHVSAKLSRRRLGRGRDAGVLCEAPDPSWFAPLLEAGDMEAFLCEILHGCQTGWACVAWWLAAWV